MCIQAVSYEPLKRMESAAVTSQYQALEHYEKPREMTAAVSQYTTVKKDAVEAPYQPLLVGRRGDPEVSYEEPTDWKAK